MQLNQFNHESFILSTLLTENREILFDARSVCECLGLKNVSDSLKRLDDDEKSLVSKELQKGIDTIYTPDGGFQDRWFLKESGLYRLIFTSKKESAVKFQRWVNHEVLPSIRKTGSYSISQDLSEDDMIAKSLLIVNDRLRKANTVIANQDKTIKKLSGEANVRVSQQAIKSASSEIADARKIPHAVAQRALYEQYKKLHGENLKIAWNNHKQLLGLKRLPLYEFNLCTGRGEKYLQAKESLLESFVVVKTSEQLSFFNAEAK